MQQALGEMQQEALLDSQVKYNQRCKLLAQFLASKEWQALREELTDRLNDYQRQLVLETEPAALYRLQGKVTALLDYHNALIGMAKQANDLKHKGGQDATGD